jgi:hypothetical protein
MFLSRGVCCCLALLATSFAFCFHLLRGSDCPSAYHKPGPIEDDRTESDSFHFHPAISCVSEFPKGNLALEADTLSQSAQRSTPESVNVPPPGHLNGPGAFFYTPGPDRHWPRCMNGSPWFRRSKTRSSLYSGLCSFSFSPLGDRCASPQSLQWHPVCGREKHHMPGRAWVRDNPVY